MAARRSYGTGPLTVRVDSAGRESWYGQWRGNGRKVKRRVGPKRTEGARDGLTRRGAEAELRRLIATTPAAAPAGERLSVGEAADRYLAALGATGRKPSTLAAVDGHVRHWIGPFLGARSLDAVRAEDVADLMRLMLDGQRPGGLRRTKPLAPKTTRNTIGTLNALYRHAIKRGWATTNPVAELDLPRVESNADIRYLEPAEVEAVAARPVPGPYPAVDTALYVTAAMTGLPLGELVALRWRDVDWTASRVRVRQNHVLGEFGTPKSRRSTRSVPMAPQVGAALDALSKAARASGDDDLVFADPLTAEPLGKPQVLRRFRAALKEAKLDDTHRFHDLRHTFGTRMAAVGVPMRTLQEWMGHRDIQTTQRYADYSPSAGEADVVAAAFGPSASAAAVVAAAA